jgi:EmrB/QacA subfamily drug resistance transporter
VSVTQTRADRPEGAAARRGQHPGIALAVVLACQLMVGLDATIVNIALPKIQSALDFSSTGLAWVFNAYTLTFGGLLLLGGRAGDILGRRRTFVIGVSLFTLASLIGGFATTSWWLVAARAAQGVGGAFASPSVLALIASNFEEGPRRNRALSLFSATSSASLALGLVLGGVLTDYVSWRWVLFVNVPIGIAIVALSPVFIGETERHRGRFDIAGALTATAGVGSLVYGFIRASSDGWRNGPGIAAFAVAAVLLIAFIVNEARVEQPIMPLRLFAERNRAGSFVNMLLVPATIFDIIYFLTQFLQDILRYSPVKAGFAFVPMTAAIFATVRVVPRLIKRFGTKPVMTVGTVLVTVAMVWLAQLDATSGYASAVLGPLLLAGIGVGLSTVPLTVTILAGVPSRDSGAASGVLQTMQWIGGGSLGLALLVTVYGTAIRHAHPAAGLGAEAAKKAVLADGISSAFAAGTAFTAIALLVALFVIRTVVPGKPAAKREPEPAAASPSQEPL